MLATRSVGWRLNTPCTIRRRHRVVDRAVADDHLAEQVGLAERREVLRAAPGRAEHRVVAAVAEMERDRHVGLGEPRPHRVVRLVAERACPSAAGRHGRGAHVHDARAALEHAVDLVDAPPAGSASEIIGAAMMRSWYEKPQSSSSQRLNAEGSPSSPGCRAAAPARRRSRASGTAARRRGPARPSSARRASRSR